MEQRRLFECFSTESSPLKTKAGVEHFELCCRSILNYCDTYRMPDCFTINPYRGCEFGCSYCYARYTHEFMELPWDEFEKKIFVKSQAPRVLLRTLDQEKIGKRHIAIGTATDPYQPAEARFKLTRRLLQVFTHVKGLSISITTKSSLVKRDVAVFKRIAEKNDFQVNISLISLDEALLRKLEPRASQPESRLGALREITGEGIRAGVFMMPILPGITDSKDNLESVIKAARLNGAHYVSSNVLFLKESAKSVFYQFLQHRYPRLQRRYQDLYSRGTYPSDQYRKHIAVLVDVLKQKYGFQGGSRARRKKRPAQTGLIGL